MEALQDEVQIQDADEKKLFKSGLEFNPPVHGAFNIVHIGLQMPEAIQIYVCAKNCMRGVILTAAEMNASERFSFVILNEEDCYQGHLDDVTIAGVIDVIAKRTKVGMRPRAVQLFTVCTHHFLGSDYNRIYRELENACPDIDFYRCYMDPIMQKKGLTPDQKLRRAMFSHFKPCALAQKTAALLGSDYLLDEDSDLALCLKNYGWKLLQMKTCRDYEEFLSMAEAELFIAIYPPAKKGVELAAKRMGRKFLYLPANFSRSETKEQLRKLSKMLEESPSADATRTQEESPSADATRTQEESPSADAARTQKENCSPDVVKMRELQTSAGPSGIEKEIETEIETACEKLKEKIKDTPIFLDAAVHPRVFGLARFLIEHDFNVEKVFADAVSPEEKDDFLWLKEHAPELIISSIIHVKKRRYVSESQDKRKILAIGQKAAYFAHTPYFVNMVAGFGLYGEEGMLKMLALMSEAFDEEKDTRDLVPRKGLGCECCL